MKAKEFPPLKSEDEMMVETEIEYFKCPFCKGGDFDLIGLKSHFEHGDCEKYNETIDIPRLF